MRGRGKELPLQQTTADHGRPWPIVLAAGVASTVLALAGVYWLDTHTDLNVMGWYVNYVIPGGALLVGIVAGSGYGIASWTTGVKISKRLLWAVVAFQVCAYVGARYLEFRALHLAFEDGTPVGFVEYFDATARSFAWKQSGGTRGEPLGVWGYAFRLLDAIGFVGGGLLVPGLLRKHPYCDACQVYRRRRQLGLLPASAAPRKLKKTDQQGQLEQQQQDEQAHARSEEMLGLLERAATEGAAAKIASLVEEHAAARKQITKLPRRTEVSIVSCPQCSDGVLEVVLIAGQGNEITRHELGRFPLAPAVVQELHHRSRLTKAS
jgi:hypothetical protein